MITEVGAEQNTMFVAMVRGIADAAKRQYR